MSSESTGKTLVVTCEETIDIGVVAELHAHLKQALADGQAVVIEAGHVERVDTAVLQTLYAFAKEARAQGLTVKWRSASASFKDAAELAGLAEGLGLVRRSTHRAL